MPKQMPKHQDQWDDGVWTRTCVCVCLCVYAPVFKCALCILVHVQACMSSCALKYMHVGECVCVPRNLCGGVPMKCEGVYLQTCLYTVRILLHVAVYMPRSM